VNLFAPYNPVDRARLRRYETFAAIVGAAGAATGALLGFFMLAFGAMADVNNPPSGGIFWLVVLGGAAVGVAAAWWVAGIAVLRDVVARPLDGRVSTKNARDIGLLVAIAVSFIPGIGAGIVLLGGYGWVRARRRLRADSAAT
jgi:hypothetical protein